VLSRGGPRNAAENFSTYRSLQRHRGVSLPRHGFLVYMDDGIGSIITTLICNMNTTLSVGCPTAVTITPPAGPFSAGDVLTCDANGNAEPSYQWTNSNGEVVSSTSTVTLLEGPFTLTCTATGNLPGQCSASDSISGDAKSKYRKQNDTFVTILMLMTLSEG